MTIVEILFLKAVLAVTDVLTSLEQSIIVGIACHYIVNELDRILRDFFTSE